MELPLKDVYETLRNIIKDKNYETIYGALLKEVKNIKKKGVSVKDKKGLETYIQNEIRELIFSQKGLSTFLIKIIILLGPQYEKDLKMRVSSYLTTNYSAEFQIYISKNFTNLKSVALLYKELETIVKNFENKYFNLPNEWNVLPDVIKALYLLIKHKLCDFFYFETVRDNDYCEALTIILSEERKFTKHILSRSENKKKHLVDSHKENFNLDFFNINDDPYVHMIYKLFIPQIEIYFKRYFWEFKDTYFDIRESEVKILTPFLAAFRSFEKLYNKMAVLENEEATSKLLEYLYELLKSMVYNCDRQFSDKLLSEYLFDQHETVTAKRHFKDIFEIIVIVLNTSEYIYDYTICFSGNLTVRINNFQSTEDFFTSLGSLEKKFTHYLSVYISHILKDIDFNRVGFSKHVINALEKFVFSLPLAEVYKEVKRVITESVVVFILSSLYLTDFNVDKAEAYICEISRLKTYFKKFTKGLPLFRVLECYIKIFLCPADNIKRFVDNFILLSNDIFSFDQIISSLTLRDTIEELKEEYSKRTAPDDILEADTI